MIDEKVLIERLEEVSYNHFDLKLSDVKAIINQLAEDHNNGWIPCSERLPEDKGEYLVCDNKGNVYTSTYFINSWLVISATDEVIAWQPLPTPYQQKGGVE